MRSAALALAATLALTAGAGQAATGQVLFRDNCSACHQVNGQGIPGAFPALAGDKIVIGDPVALSRLVLEGRGGMPAFNGELSEADLASLLTYVRASWGNKAKPLTLADIARAKARPAKPAPTPGRQAH